MSIESLVKVKRSRRARRVALRLDPKERVVNLVIPERMNLSRAYNFALKHEDWVRKTLENLPATVPFVHGAKIPILGEEKQINIIRTSAIKRTDIQLIGNELIIYTNLEDPSLRIRRFIKNLARDELAKLSNQKAALLGKTVKSVSVRDTKTRWGSCSHDGHLSFSWRLIFAPFSTFDYVVAHEVAHLKHMNHSQKFWALCRELSEDFTTGRHWMRINSNNLMRYG